jgi:flagellar biogenesis protein FliO
MKWAARSAMKFDEDAAATPGSNFWRVGFRPWNLFSRLGLWNRPARKLHLRETVSLGNRGLLAVVQYQDQQFLLGCTNTSIAMLAQLSGDSQTDAAKRQDSREKE